MLYPYIFAVYRKHAYYALILQHKNLFYLA